MSSGFQIVVRKIDNGYLVQGFVDPANGEPREITKACPEFKDVADEMVNILNLAGQEAVDTPEKAITYDSDVPSSS